MLVRMTMHMGANRTISKARPNAALIGVLSDEGLHCTLTWL